MINRDDIDLNDIEVGDKCYTRDGGCLVARPSGEGLLLGESLSDRWELDGQYGSFHDHPLDIIRIEKAPKPVVAYIGVNIVFNGISTLGSYNIKHIDAYDHAIKLTIINGKLDKAEQVK